ncbi:hypothetical protein [Paenibacillus sp. YN15]|uniref:hypothetical protein n=1 Tax=Paenibacillus sp. YN15 TaxID=1742774 RepID=UPI000DCC399D|nr:hypothetical protein [Paenibacillus sp. YN15]RAU93315.1 hypothetical protein DQG13_25980 [Paenibacillus sp. YN15]
MSEAVKNHNSFVGYEYKEITVSRTMESVHADCYENFGWTLEGTSQPIQGISSVALKFKRDRKIRNKAELTRLQRQLDACIRDVEMLEKSKTTSAAVAAFSLGIVGTAFMAGSVFAYIGGLTALSVILAVPAFAGWIIPYFSYMTIRQKRTAAVAPMIDEKYDEIYEICEKANTLLG